MDLERGPGGPPSLQAAWSHFRTVTLPRRVGKRLAAKSEAQAGAGDLFSVWATPVSELGSFGVGVGLYFSTLLGLSAVMLVCAAVTTPAMLRMSEDYDQGDLPLSVRGSAACDAASPDANGCALDAWNAYADLACVAVLGLFCLLSGRAQDKIVTALDEALQTTQDYAIVVEDPDPTATSPDEWHQWFSERFGSVAYVTVVKDNGELLRALARKRYVEQQIFFEAVDDEPPPSPLRRSLQPLGLFREVSYWRRQLNLVLRDLERLVEREYHAIKVFVVFEHEEGQRKCLQALTVGLIPGLLNHSTAVKPEHKFRGENVLLVREPVEPSEVLWGSLGTSFAYRAKQQAASMLLSVALMVGAFFAIRAAADVGPGLASITISGFNAALPLTLKVITSLETHVDAGNMQESLLVKLVLCRMLTTAVIIYVLTDWEDQNSEAAMTQIQSILIADAFTTPVLRLLNLGGRLQMLLLAPRARTQAKMNSYFGGTQWNLAERYTDMSKTLFVSLFYSALLPSGMYITAVSFLSTYWVDKYCLLRQWRRPPQLDDSLATKNRGHIIFCVYVHVLMTARFYAGWPFDAVCEDQDSGALYACDKRPDSWVFPRPDGDWMSADQARVTTIYGLLALVMGVLCVGHFFGDGCWSFFKSLYRGNYKPVGKTQGIPFSSVAGIPAYVPMLEVPTLSDPLLACDLATVDERNVVSTGDKEKTCLYLDIPANDTVRRQVLSVCQSYDPEHPVYGRTRQARANTANPLFTRTLSSLSESGPVLAGAPPSTPSAPTAAAAAAATPTPTSSKRKLTRGRSARSLSAAAKSPLTRTMSMSGEQAAPPDSCNPNARRKSPSLSGQDAMPRAAPLVELTALASDRGDDDGDSGLVKRTVVRAFTQCPPGWELHADQGSGRDYYYCPSLKESVFVPDPSAVAAAGASGARVTVAPPTAGMGRQMRSRSRVGRRPTPPRGPVVPLGETSVLQELDSGWNLMRDLTGQTFFQHRESGELSWNAPARKGL